MPGGARQRFEAQTVQVRQRFFRRSDMDAAFGGNLGMFSRRGCPY
jgi:hypothetical protein